MTRLRLGDRAEIVVQVRARAKRELGMSRAHGALQCEIRLELKRKLPAGLVQEEKKFMSVRSGFCQTARVPHYLLIRRCALGAATAGLQRGVCWRALGFINGASDPGACIQIFQQPNTVKSFL